MRVAVHHGGAVTDARVAAAEICADLRAGELLDPAFDRRTARLDARDRRWVRELVYGMLRRRARLDAYLDARVRGGIGSPRRRPARPPPARRGAAAVHGERAGVRGHRADRRAGEAPPRHGREQARERRAAPARSRARERSALPTHRPIRSTRSRSDGSHPRWIVARWVARWGIDETRQLLEANNREAPLVARPCARRARAARGDARDRRAFTSSDAPLVRDSIVLVEPGVVAHRARAVPPGPVSPAGSGVDARHAVRLRARPAPSVADVCAAPGGKSVELSRERVACVRERPLVCASATRASRTPSRLEIDTLHAYVADARFPAIRPVDLVLRRCAVHRHGNVPPPPRRALASQDLRPRGDGVDPARRSCGPPRRRVKPGRAARRTAPVRSSPKRTTSRSRRFLRRASRLEARSAARRRGAGDRAGSRTAAACCRNATARTARSRARLRRGARRERSRTRVPRLAAVCGRDHRRLPRRLSDRRVRRFFRRA